ncbi:DnaD domain protein [Ligilactobacillus salivarius]|uniref:DnaD domain protein n=1 Tax=Ligilactobacillus salivarius TaxID=1624 RepID=UPI002096C271|nr:DnaD domain protein [Ligilactobacillus salivarius]MCO7134579.1 DnaD domain protein [Ligilactobacillus salivarius]MDN4848502.1 DnaD domain protein [Ligilactobacillus salivarius]MDW3022752.1 DnaD domain protein [Ligilactobacillus salivarius]
MDSALNKLSPKDGYLVSASTYIDNHDIEIVQVLYQPIIGIVAVALYSYLRFEIDPKLILSERKLNKNIIDGLGISIPELYDARLKLEATGLIKTFEGEDKLGKYHIYELQKPLNEVKFFTDDLLSTALLEMVGNEKFKKLSLWNKFDNNYHDKKEVTKQFFDVFNLNKDNIVLQAQLNNSKISNDESLINRQKVSLDMTVFSDFIKNSYISSDDVMDHLDIIKSVKLVYGIDEFQLVKLLEKAINVTNNKIDYNEFKKLAQKNFDSGIRRNFKENKIVETAKAKDDEKDKNIDPLVNAFKAYVPLEFLEILKNELGSFVTANERYAVKTLVEKQMLPNEVINVLIHYLLVVQDSSTILKGTFERIAADWTKKKIRNAQEAMTYVKSFTREKSLQRKTTKKDSKGRKSNVIVKEKLPEWAKEKGKNKLTDVGKKENKEIDELLKKINGK